jgi:hypothetical protein
LRDILPNVESIIIEFVVAKGGNKGIDAVSGKLLVVVVAEPVDRSVVNRKGSQEGKKKQSDPVGEAVFPGSTGRES